MITATIRTSGTRLACMRSLKYQRKVQNKHLLNYHSATIDIMDYIPTESLQSHKNKTQGNKSHKFAIQYFMKHDSHTIKPVTDMTEGELDELLKQLVLKNNDKQVESIIEECQYITKFISDASLKNLFRYYSANGKPDIVLVLRKYCLKVIPNLYKRNGEFLHYSAKAQCMRGNSEKGLSLLENAYEKNEWLRSFYRTIFRELIHDSVLNRSEASLVIFKKYVRIFSDRWREHYPIVCFWHICWSSSWFSDQIIADELLESSEALRNIVWDKATTFSTAILRSEYNDDAVMRLLQALLKYDMMEEYVKILQVLFGYKLRKGDLRGCTEIIKNCEVLGINLPADQQGKYINMLIGGKTKKVKSESKNFKLKF